MIRKLFNMLSKYKIWIVTIGILNIMFGVFLWLMDVKGFIYIFPTTIIGSIILYSFVGFKVYNVDKRKKQELLNFIGNSEIKQEELCLSFFSNEEKNTIRAIGEKLREKDDLIKQQYLNLKEYEEYIEKWTHEIKTPLSLMTFVLDNRKEEISLSTYKRLEYARTKMQEDIERMLYYARVKSDHLDYLFSNILLDEICEDLLDEYKILIDEQKISINSNVKNIQVFSDKKGLLFILRQILSNAIKYKDMEDENFFISIFTTVNEESKYIILTIRDNGIGIKSYDVPFLFDKGFTGDAGQQRKQSTGMGLYLAKQVADNLNIKMVVSPQYKDGFEISLLFPIV
ncbi:sensor histidine kinase [Terrisporobacter petrolearius]|uniref:sensor histidine kinase n=1 Tax=Terrisporobacter petrolearius TaxID=1460447 RepID=UPI001D160621|nr:sensor histidine kinase [Terrisporobacter petrolearius]MCC3865228.1 sensor histidine kinase [Terrisporobacter petrolearius]